METRLSELHKVVAAAHEERKPVFLVGTSWGARQALAYAQTPRLEIKAVALIAPAFWTSADRPSGALVARILRVFGMSANLEKRLPGMVYLPDCRASIPEQTRADFLEDMNRDQRLVQRATFRFLDEANRLSARGLRGNPAAPVPVFFDGADALVKQPKSERELEKRGLKVERGTSSGHGVQVIAPEELARVLRPWLERKLSTP